MPTPPVIIIAEPDPMISSVLRVEFSHGDFAVLLATTGQEAEDYAAHTVAHLVILDTVLHLAAFDACARIRRRQGYAGRPIVLTTKAKSPMIKEAAEKAGATLLLPKPYSVNDLFSAIRPFVQPNDPLLTHRAPARGMAEHKEWKGAAAVFDWQSGRNSALTRNGQLLPIVRGKGVSIPLIRKS